MQKNTFFIEVELFNDPLFNAETTMVYKGCFEVPRVGGFSYALKTTGANKYFNSLAECEIEIENLILKCFNVKYCRIYRFDFAKNEFVFYRGGYVSERAINNPLSLYYED